MIDAAVVVAVGTDGEAPGPVAVGVAEPGQRRGELVLPVDRAREAPRGVADLGVRLHGAVGVHEQHPHGAVVGPAVVVAAGAGREVRDRVTVEVVEGGDGAAEEVGVVQRPGEPAGGVADPGVRLHGAVGVEKEHPHRAAIGATVVHPARAHREVGDAVAVEVPEPAHRGPEEVRVRERVGQTPFGRADLAVRLHGPVGVHEEDPDRPALGATVVVEGRAGGEVGHAIAVEVPQGGDGPPEVVEVVEHARKAPVELADLLVGLHRPVGVEEEDPQRSVLGAAVVIGRGGGDEIADRVPVEITGKGQREAELVVVVERSGEPALGRADLGVGLHLTVDGEEEHVDRPAVGTAVVVGRGARRQVRRPVAVEVAHRGDGDPKEIEVVEHRGEAALGRADLLVPEDLAGRGGPGGDARGQGRGDDDRRMDRTTSNE